MTNNRFTVDALPWMPWKNGGGRTRELACWPAGCGLGDFDARVSMAEIATDGPFSAFDGIDRTIMLLNGPGIQMMSPGFSHRLDTRLAPFAFAGEAPLTATLLGSASIDFNLMVRRGRMRAQLRVVRGAASLPAATHGFVLAVRGGWSFDDVIGPLSAGHGMTWSDEPLQLNARGGDELVAVLLKELK